MEHKMSVEEMCSAIGWSPTDLSHEARIDYRTAKSAYDGQEPSQRVKREICRAFSQGFNRTVTIPEIAWFVTH